MALPRIGTLAGSVIPDSTNLGDPHPRLSKASCSLSSIADASRVGLCRGFSRSGSGDAAISQLSVATASSLFGGRRRGSHVAARAWSTLAEVEAEGEERNWHESEGCDGREGLGEGVPSSVALQLEMQLLSPRLPSHEWGCSTPEGVRALISEMVRPGTLQATWQHLVNSVSPRRGATQHTVSSQQASSGVHLSEQGHRQPSALRQQRRRLAMVLLQECFASLLNQRSVSIDQGSTVVGLVEHMVEQGLLPDTPLSLFLLEELWSMGQEEAAVKLLILLLRKDNRVTETDDKRSSHPELQVCSGNSELSTIASTNASLLRKDVALGAGVDLPGGLSIIEVPQKEMAGETGRQPDRSAGVLDLPAEMMTIRSPSQGTPARPLIGGRQAAALRDSLSAADTCPSASSSQAAGERGEEDRCFEGLGTQRRADVDNLPFEWQEATLLPSQSAGSSGRVPDADDLSAQPWGGMRSAGLKGELAMTSAGAGARPEKEGEEDRRTRLRAEVKWRMQQQVARTLEGTASKPPVAAAMGLGSSSLELQTREERGDNPVSGQADLALHMLRYASNRGQFRTALALPRRLRHAGVQLSVAAYDAALLAVVKEQELLADAEHQVQEMQSVAKVERLTALDQLNIQVYGETLRAEGEAILVWAMLGLQDMRSAHSQTQNMGAQHQETHSQEAPLQALPTRGTQGRVPSALACAQYEASLHEKMLALWCIAGQGVKGEGALWRIAEAGRVPSRDMVAAVLGTLAYKGNMFAVQRVLSRTEAMGVVVDSALLSLVVGAALKGGHLQGASIAMLSMVERGLSPEKAQMASLLRLLQRDGHVESYLVLSSALSGAGFTGPCLVYFYLDFIRFCIIRML